MLQPHEGQHVHLLRKEITTNPEGPLPLPKKKGNLEKGVIEQKPEYLYTDDEKRGKDCRVFWGSGKAAINTRLGEKF